MAREKGKAPSNNVVESEKGKRRSKDVSRNPNPAKRGRFMSEEAEIIYKGSQGKSSVPERGIEVGSITSPFVRKILEFYNWAPDERLEQDETKVWFTSQPPPAVTNIVHEFYANLKSLDTKEEGIVTIRGKQVNFHANTINAYYSLKAPSKCWYFETNPSEIDWEDILAHLAKPGTTWKKGKKGNPKEFPSASLKRDYRVLFYFLSARLIPGTHYTFVTKERALLLFGIVSRLPLNVGHIIEASIFAAVQGTGNRGWVMPSLITSLCLKKGVVISDDEARERPIRSLDHHVYSQMRDDDEDTLPRNPVTRGTLRERRPVFTASVERRPRSEDRLKRLEDSVAEMRTHQGMMQARMEEQFSGIADSLKTLHDMVLQLMVAPRVERVESRPSSPPCAPMMATYTRRRRAHSTAPDDEFHTPATSAAGFDSSALP